MVTYFHALVNTFLCPLLLDISRGSVGCVSGEFMTFEPRFEYFCGILIEYFYESIIAKFVYFYSISAPHQPRLDWQLWFAALESYTENPWFLSFIHKLLLGKQDVLQLMGKVPFNRSSPQFIRAQLYMYHYTQNTSSIWQVLLHPR